MFKDWKISENQPSISDQPTYDTFPPGNASFRSFFFTLYRETKQKRIGFSIVAWSYSLLLIVTLLLHGQYVSLNTGWIYWLLTLLIVLSASFFVSAAVSALKPAMFSKNNRGDKATPHRDSLIALKGSEAQLPSFSEPVTDLSNQDVREKAHEPRSVVEDTTRKLNESKKLS